MAVSVADCGNVNATLRMKMKFILDSGPSSEYPVACEAHGQQWYPSTMQYTALIMYYTQ